jgi:hypothetical protein
MRTNLGLIGRYSTKSAEGLDYNSLKNKSNELTDENIIRMKTYLQEYKAFKRGTRYDLKSAYENLDGFVAYLRKECIASISSNESELADYAIEVTYGEEVSMVEFCWRMFPQGMLQNIMSNSNGCIRLPVEDPDGDINYLWRKYSIKEFQLKDIYAE